MTNIQQDDERNEMCDWFELINPTFRHNETCKLHEDQTGQWMLRSPEWKDWLQGSTQFLWVYGIPGSGKTVLASYLIRKIEELCSNQRHALVYYYCWFENNQDESEPLLRWLVTQLCRQAKRMPPKLVDLYQRKHQPTTIHLLTALETILDDFDLVYFVVDAVDESDPRDNILKVLRDLVTDPRFAKIRLLATSREYYDIETCFTNISTSVSMSNPVVTEDIRVYVYSQLRSNYRFKDWPPDLLREVEDAISKGAHGM